MVMNFFFSNFIFKLKTKPMKKVLLMTLLFGAMMVGFVSCGGEAEPAEGADTTHTEGDGHSH